MKKKMLWTCIVFALFVFAGCTTTPIENQYPDRWEKTIIGMSLDEFKQVWPESRWSGSGDLQNTTEIWTFSKRGLLGVEIEYFIFEDNKLIRFEGTGTN
jgi:hypothetical protein